MGVTFHHVQAGREHLCGDDAELLGIIAEAGNDTRLVVIVPVQAVPRLALELILPFVQDRAEYGELRLLIGPFSDRSRYAVNMLKLEDHVQLGLLFVCVFFASSVVTSPASPTVSRSYLESTRRFISCRYSCTCGPLQTYGEKLPYSPSVTGPSG